jgi:hypothetical protein
MTTRMAKRLMEIIQHNVLAAKRTSFAGAKKELIEYLKDVDPGEVFWMMEDAINGHDEYWRRFNKG